jgi:selenocysteine lyase/cysteine desulfurase
VLKTEIIDHYSESLSLPVIQKQFVGVDTQYKLVDGDSSQRIYLDSAASCLMLKPALKAGIKFLEHYSNTHSNIHFSAKVTNSSYQWAHKKILDFVSANSDDYSAIFIGSGATAAINRAAKLFRQQRPEKNGVLISIMEHHSNDLPHRMHHDFYHHIPCVGSDKDLGAVCLKSLKILLKEKQNTINYIAVTAASNVTGIVNPIHDIAELAHEYGAMIIVDASQYAAHKPLQINDSNNPARALDALVLSGHKLYSPGSPGVLVIRNSLLSSSVPVELGGGMVDTVYTDEYISLNEFPDREEAGTPNIFGAITLAMTLDVLDRLDMSEVARHEKKLLEHLFDLLKKIPDLVIYGDNNLSLYPRTATISFNLAGVDHELLACILNDYFNIAVRNECFCAHPYVREMILKELWEIDPDSKDEEIESKKGMVRASFGLYNTMDHVNALAQALFDISTNKEFYQKQYLLQSNGHYKHKSYQMRELDLLHPEKILESELLALSSY